jgi:hypothetical protein
METTMKKLIASALLAGFALVAIPTVKVATAPNGRRITETLASVDVVMLTAYAVTCSGCTGAWTCDKSGKNCVCSGREVSCK